VFTVDQVPEGDAFDTNNTQQYGLQLGVNVTQATPVFTVHSRIVGPFLGLTPQDFQSMGVFVGDGTQADYVKVVTSAIGGVGGVELVKEAANVVTFGAVLGVPMPGPEAVDLFLSVNPAAATVQGYFTVTDSNGATGPLTALGAPMPVPAAWFTNATRGLAVGVLATSRGAAPPFPATWDLIEVTPGQPTCPDPDGDTQCSGSDPCPNDGTNDADGDGICAGATFNAPKTGAGDNCPAHVNAAQADGDVDGRGDACDACPLVTGAAEDACLGSGVWTSVAPTTQLRSEVGMAAVGGKNYLLGGQQANSAILEIYDVATNTWTTGPSLPAARHHVQPVVVNDKIYVIGGLTGFPGPSMDSVLMFDPANPGAGWQTRASLPTSRGASGCAAEGIKIYCAGGLSSTAGNTAIAAMEVYNTVTNTWATLAPMPRVRDHFQAAVINGKFYAVSGRDTAITATNTFNDVYDIATNTWTQGAPIPTARGGYSVAVLQGRLIVISGEGNGPNSGTFPQVEEYDPARDVWRALTNITTSRHGSGVAINSAPDGIERVYVAAGGPAQGNSQTTAHQHFRY
jgi:N-acetylneuraminic acid mutarotase